MRRLKIGLSMSLMTANLFLFMGMSSLIGSVSAMFGQIGKADSNKVASNNHEIDMLNDMLVGRTGSDVVFEQAKDIIKRLSYSPICAHDATKQLLTTCKRTEATNKNPESASILENAKTVYAIRHAVCQVRSAKSPVPDVCLSIERISEASVNHVEILPDHDITVCLKALSQGHFWTSYSNSLQDASVLCDPARIDYQQEELLDNYRELTHELPGFVEGLKRYMQSIFSHFDHLKSNVQGEMRNLSEQIGMTTALHLQIRTSFQDTVEKAQKAVTEIMRAHAQEMSSLRIKTSDVSEALATIPDQVQAITFDLFATLSQSANESLATVQNLAVDIQRLVGNGFQQIQEPMTILQRDLQELQAKQTIIFQEQYTFALNISNMNKLTYENAVATNQLLNTLQGTVDTMVTDLTGVVATVNGMVATLKGVFALGSSFGFSAFLFIIGIVLMIVSPRFKTIGVLLVLVIIYKISNFLFSPGLFTGIGVGLNFGLLEFMLWAVAGTLIVSGLLLAWVQKRRGAKASKAMPPACSTFVIEGLETVRLSNKPHNKTRAATVV